MMSIRNYMEKEIKSKELLTIMEKRQELSENGYKYFDNIKDIISKIIKGNMKNIASGDDIFDFIKPYVKKEDYTEAKEKIEEEYRQIKKLDYKMAKLKDKVQVILKNEKIELKEFEEVGQVTIRKGKVYTEIIDKVENYKEMLREKLEQK